MGSKLSKFAPRDLSLYRLEGQRGSHRESPEKGRRC